MERIYATDIKGIIKEDGAFGIELLGLPFGGPIHGRDSQRQYFSKRTDFQMTPGDQLPAVYFHGYNSDKAGFNPTPEFYGKATLTRFDMRGGWFDVSIDEDKRHATDLYKAAVKGTLRGSAGRAGRLERQLPDGELMLYVPGEMSLIDQNYNRIAVNNLAIGQLKALYIEAGLHLPKEFHEETRQERKVILTYKNEDYSYEKIKISFKP